jgi:hypothetical protein
LIIAVVLVSYAKSSGFGPALVRCVTSIVSERSRAMPGVAISRLGDGPEL